ncbi:MAG: MFS transporter [Nodosilinea sp.]
MLREFDIDTSATEANQRPSAEPPQADQINPDNPSTSALNDPEGSSSLAPNDVAEPSSDRPAEPTRRLTLPRPPGFEAVFQNRNFLTLWTGQLFSQLADKVYLVLMIAIIAARFESPGQTISGWVSAVMIAFTVPAVLFGALAGVFVDRWQKQSVLVWSNVLRGALVISLPVGFWVTSGWGTVAGLPVAFWLLLGITFVISTLTQFFAPAEQAIIPLIVEEGNLLSANSLYTTTMMASVIVGFAVGEPLLALADGLMSRLGMAHNGPAILVGLSYLFAGLCLMAMTPGQETLSKSREVPHFLADIRDGVSYLNQQAQVRVAILQLVLLSSVFAALAVLAVRLAEMMPAIKASQFGFLLAAGGVGLAVGAILVGHFGRRFSKRYLSLGGTLGMAGCLVALAWTTQQLWLSLGLLAVLGLCGACVGIPMQTLIQEKTPEAMRGKVFGLQNNLINIALCLPLALASVVETALGLANVFIGLGVFVGIGGVVTWYIADTALRQP